MKQLKNVVFQGDSITDAGRAPGQPCNENLGGGYAMMTAAQLRLRHPAMNLRVYNTGISGNRVVDLYARWKIDTLALKPDLLSIMIGVNDTWHEFGSGNGVELERYERFYRELLEWTAEASPGAAFVLLDPFILPLEAGANPAMVDDVAARRSIVQKLAREFDATHLKTQELFDAALLKAPAEYWSGDGVHPTLAGHALMAQAWLDITQPLFG